MSAGGPPSGVVTFLFTDIEGSTRRWEADAQSMRAALLVHDEVLRTAIEAHDGFLFSHTGDGVVAAFASPRSAVDAAVAAQRELHLPVRMGIATGEADLRDGDYFGTVLNRAARVMTAGHGGQVLVADTTAGLLGGVDLVNLGHRRLRDIPSPITVYQLRAPGLRTEFPPLRTLDANPGNLRPATTSLIGRNAEIAEVEAAVRAHRMVTLTGVGGVGKTRLALEVAARMADEFPDGVWVFELAAVTDPVAVPEAVAAVLGITQQPGKTVGESVSATLEGRLRLLVYDNCEHVLDSVADLVEGILASSTTVRILATSREGVGVAEEQLWPVSSLEIDAAVDLFIERAHSVAPGFRADQTSAVKEICRRLDGIPLAIELAASRMSSMSAGEVRDRLDHRFKLLVGSRRGLGRHHTLRHAVAWSYDLLDDPEKELLERCSVFAGGFELQSACAVAGFDDVDDYSVLDLLDALVRKSLLVVDRSADRTRFSMLETIRQFAEDQLVARGAATETRGAHARYFAGREADILALWDSPRQREAYTWFTVELANLRTAFRWAADYNDLDAAATIATYAPFLGNMVGSNEPIAWAEELIAPAGAVNHPRLAALYVMVSACWMSGRIESAVGYSDAGQVVVANDRNHVPFGTEGWLGAPYQAVGQPERSIQWCRSQLGRGLDTHTLTRAYLIVILAVTGSGHDAMAAANGLIDQAETTRNPYALTFALLACGVAFRDADPDRAMADLRRGLAIAHETGNRYSETNLALMLSGLQAEYGDPLSALDNVVLAISNHHDSGNIVIRSSLAVLAGLLDRIGRHEPSAIIAGFAFSALTTVGVGYPEVDTTIAHLRDVLGDTAYESCAREGAAMTTAEMVAYAYDQIDQARIELEQLA